MAAPSPKHGFGFPLDQWLRGKLPRAWREWQLTNILAQAGFRPAALDALISRYEHVSLNANGDHQRESRALAARLYDLTLLGVWMDRYGPGEGSAAKLSRSTGSVPSSVAVIVWMTAPFSKSCTTNVRGVVTPAGQ